MSAELAALRKSLSAKRRALSLEEVEERSRLVCDNVVRFCAERWTAETWLRGYVGLYKVTEANPPREVNPESLVSRTYFSGASFVYPRVESLADGQMEFVCAPHSTDWREGALGLFEPRPELPAVPPKELHLAICPGVLFDETGGRAGRGRGFYDRYLVRTPGTFRIGIAYDFQVVSKGLPLEPHDQRMDAVITESRILTFDARSAIRTLAPDAS